MFWVTKHYLLNGRHLVLVPPCIQMIKRSRTKARKKSYTNELDHEEGRY